MATIRIAVEQVEDRSGGPVKPSVKLVRRSNSSRFSIFAALVGEVISFSRGCLFPSTETEREAGEEGKREGELGTLRRRIDAFLRLVLGDTSQNPVCNSHCGPEQSAAGYAKLARFPFIYDPAPCGIFGKISRAK